MSCFYYYYYFYYYYHHFYYCCRRRYYLLCLLIYNLRNVNIYLFDVILSKVLAIKLKELAISKFKYIKHVYICSHQENPLDQVQIISLFSTHTVAGSTYRSQLREPSHIKPSPTSPTQPPPHKSDYMSDIPYN